MLTKFIDILLSLSMIFSFAAPASQVKRDEWNTNYRYVFVHGLSGWGHYDLANKVVMYWGMFSGDVFGTLKKAGFDCYAASVDPTGSAWDRACELYAQLTGTVTDYGKAHSERCNHARYGKDFTGRALIPVWNADEKINLLGHSFGGATVRLLAELMANGSQAERAATDEADLSGLFTGGKADWIYSLTTLSAPHNGTSAYTVGTKGKPVQRTNDGLTGGLRAFLSSFVSIGTQPIPDGRIEEDYASTDMEIDRALEMNKGISTLSNVYYFSFCTTATDVNEAGEYVPDTEIMEPLFTGSSELIGKYTGQTAGGYVLDESWRENDGLVNLISAKAPFGAPQKEFDENGIEPGVWQIFPVMRGDHMTFMGGLTVRHPELKEFYLTHLDRINRI